ncbi:MAG: rhomboid family intramembrane serine protease [Spirochaetes bacterium]|nr:rhomboid family intramembrane serine protease [Spirochaetota bacterium]
MPGLIERMFGLSHTGIFYEFKLWQPFTYMFIHGGWMHIIFNLIALWMFAGELEQMWGSRAFLRYYLFSGLGAGFFIIIMNFIVYNRYGYAPVTIGASGAIYGILLAYGITWPNREVLLYFVLPVKIKYLIIAFGLMEFFGTLSSAVGSGGNISHIGHLGGLISGYIYILYSRSGGKDDPEKSSYNKNINMINEFLRKERLKRKQLEIDDRIEAKKIIDILLEKIAREGMSSLSPKERKQLEWARKHYYPADGDTVH